MSVLSWRFGQPLAPVAMVRCLQLAAVWRGGAGFRFPGRSLVCSKFLPQEARSGVLQQLQCSGMSEGTMVV
jgi:hypothetical protein